MMRGRARLPGRQQMVIDATGGDDTMRLAQPPRQPKRRLVGAWRRGFAGARCAPVDLADHAIELALDHLEAVILPDEAVERRAGRELSADIEAHRAQRRRPRAAILVDQQPENDEAALRVEPLQVHRSVADREREEAGFIERGANLDVADASGKVASPSSAAGRGPKLAMVSRSMTGK